MLSRRSFLASAAVGPCLPVLSRANGEEELPVGVLPPWHWEEAEIPVSGDNHTGTAVIDEAVTAAMRQHGIVGCGVCVTRGAEVVYAKGFGYAELPQTPFLPTTATRCGSLAKPVTALCGLLLMDEGKLDLDSPILPILKKIGVEPRPVEPTTVDDRISRIRVRHLMDHTSGLPGWATYTAWRANRNVAVVQKLSHVATGADVASDALGNTELKAEPGTRFEYANANFVLLARVIEACSGMGFNDFLTRVAMPRFGLRPEDIYVSRNQDSPKSPARGKNEPAYYQTSAERYVSYLPSELEKGRVFGEAYRGYATESSDGAGGIACTAPAIARIIANLSSDAPALRPASLKEISTPPEHYQAGSDFDPAKNGFYSKGFNVRVINGRAWFAHGGMTNHCGGIIGHNAGYQFVAVSNWNNAQSPYVDALLGQALGPAMSKLRE